MVIRNVYDNSLNYGFNKISYAPPSRGRKGFL